LIADRFASIVNGKKSGINAVARAYCYGSLQNRQGIAGIGNIRVTITLAAVFGCSAGAYINSRIIIRSISLLRWYISTIAINNPAVHGKARVGASYIHAAAVITGRSGGILEAGNGNIIINDNRSVVNINPPAVRAGIQAAAAKGKTAL